MRAVTLSVDPVFSKLKDNYICGYSDISNKKFAGASGKHKPDQNAVHTTNGAGPHNVQIFVIAPDGVVLHCLPGYWKPEDLGHELDFAQSINEVWQNPNLTVTDKRQMFSEMNMAHIKEHDQSLAKRSRMQGFDLAYEAKHNPRSDFFYNPAKVDSTNGQTPKENVKSVDVVMHERMARRPFVPYQHFDVEVFSSYGKLLYDKHEQFRLADGSIGPGANLNDAPMIGNTPKAHPIKTGIKKTGGQILQTTVNQAVRYGIRAIMP